MRSFTVASFALIALYLPLDVSAGPHDNRNRTVRRRHHSRQSAAGQARRDLGCDEDAPATTCTYGAWQCQGAELQRCWNDDWHVVQNCTGENQVCSTDSRAVGCIWTWSLPSTPSDSTDTTDSDVPSGSGTVTSPGTSPSATSASAVSAAVPSPSPTSVLITDPTDPNDTQTPTNTTTTNEDDEDDDDDDDDEWECDDDDDEDTTASVTSALASSTTTVVPATDLGGQLYAGHNVSTASASQTFPLNATMSTSATTTAAAQNANSTGLVDANVTASAISVSTTALAISTNTSATLSVPTAINSSSTSSYHKSKSSSSATITTSAALATATSNATTGSDTTPSTLGTFTAPHYVVYADNWLFSMPSAKTIGSYNRFVLAFWMTNRGPVDDAQAWAWFSASTRKSVLKEYHDAGIALMVSAFGSTDAPTSNGADPTQTARNLAQYVKDYGLDGVDIDYEDMPAMNSNKAEVWLITFQRELRNQLPAPYIISHAPVAPWFTSANDYTSGAYVKIHQAVGHTIDFYNIQFYNQGHGVYENCETLIHDSGSSWPSTSVMEINSYAGVPLEKIVIGKPLKSGDADNGFVSASLLGSCVAQAKALGWNAGVMFWQWSTDAPGLMATVLGH